MMGENPSNPAKIAQLLSEGDFERRWHCLVNGIADRVPGSTWDDLITGIKIANEIAKGEANERLEAEIEARWGK